MTPINCSCPCNHAQFTLHEQPKVRFYCHCGICQRVYKQPYSDFVILPSEKVSLSHKSVNFHKMRPPPNLGRGLCVSCNAPVAGIFNAVPGLSFTFVPVANIRDEIDLPEAYGHLFYHCRSEEVEDKTKKHLSYLTSQWAISKAVLKDLVLS